MKKLLLILALFLATPCFAQQLTVVQPTPYGPLWSINKTTGTTAISGVTQVPFDTKLYDTATICNVTSTFVCTPNVAGYYQVTCASFVSMTTGPALTGALGIAYVRKNGSPVYQITTEAQVATIAGPDAFPLVSGIVQVNGSSDTLDCAAASAGSVPLILPSAVRTYMTGSFVHP